MIRTRVAKGILFPAVSKIRFCQTRNLQVSVAHRSDKDNKDDVDSDLASSSSSGSHATRRPAFSASSTADGLPTRARVLEIASQQTTKHLDRLDKNFADWVKYMDKAVNELQSDVKDLRKAVNELQCDVKDLRKAVNELQSDVKDLRRDMDVKFAGLRRDTDVKFADLRRGMDVKFAEAAAENSIKLNDAMQKLQEALDKKFSRVVFKAAFILYAAAVATVSIGIFTLDQKFGRKQQDHPVGDKAVSGKQLGVVRH